MLIYLQDKVDVFEARTMPMTLASQTYALGICMVYTTLNLGLLRYDTLT